MKLLITGANGYLGKGLVPPVAERHSVRLMDVVPFASRHEVVVGDVADLETCRKAVAGMESIVIAHMAPRLEGAYETPTLAFDANVKGTANLFFAAAERHIQRIILISSTGLMTPPKPRGPARYRSGEFGFYQLTKACQEAIAEHFRHVCGMQIALMRCGWIMDAESMIDKYGQHRVVRSPDMIDRRDIGEAVRLALELPDLAFETFVLVGTPERRKIPEVVRTEQRLGWKPKYDFSGVPLAEPKTRK